MTITPPGVNAICDVMMMPGGFLKKNTNTINMEKVLMIISPENILTHVGQPDGFGVNLIYSYVMDGYTVTTITIDYYREQNFKLYESVDLKIMKK